MTRSFILFISILFLAAGCTSEDGTQSSAEAVETREDPAPSEPPAADLNVVQTEMQLLTTVLEHAVRGVGEGDVSHIAQELHQLHEAKEATEAAVKDGSYTLPKNSDQVSTFLTMDEVFHSQLEGMVHASRANDVPAMALAIGRTLNSCSSCHTLFRDP